MEVKLVVLEGKQKDREIPLPETIFLIGRDSQCHLRPHCLGVSKLHCAIAAWAGKVRVRDLKSRNGTFLNGKPIQGEVSVGDGDQLQVGTLVFAFKIKDAEGTPRIAPIKDPREVQWLLESPADSGVLAAANETCVIPIPAKLGHATESQSDESDPSAEQPDAAVARGSKAVSAGQNLRSYFEGRRRRPPTPAPAQRQDKKP